jgi:alkanesulfonate monooxygenase SsuD/methylene tetrahydromethanopterin reductase-like flavin-dependent oxidoreductase (luciferase family)
MTKRDFGMNLPVSGRSYSRDEVELSFEVLKQIALTADKNGFKTIGVHDHLLNPQGSAPGGKEMPERFRYGIMEAWTTLSAISTITSRARLTNAVLCNPFRYPAVLAKMASTLDVISNGRVNLAMGAGWFRGEFLAYGVPWKPYKVRLEMLKESVQIIKKLWTEEKVNFVGKHYRIENGILNPKPVQHPRPPIVIGGSSESVMKIAIEEADGWDVDTGPCTFEMFQDRYAKLERYCAEVGRTAKSIRISVNATPIYAETMSEARKLGSIWAEKIGKDPEEYMSSKAVLVGTAGDIISSAEKWFEAGVDQINFLMPHDAGYAQRLSEAMTGVGY